MIELQKTLRSAARAAVIEQVSERARLEHMRNIHKLLIFRSGLVHWSEFINTTDDILDTGATHFAAVPSVATVGTGSYECNCDQCNEVYNADEETRAATECRSYNLDNKWSTKAEAVAEAVSESDLSEVEQDMLDRFDRIEVGYFDDEEINHGNIHPR